MDKNKQLCTAAWDGNVAAVKNFVNLGVEVNELNGRETALHFACFRGHLSVVKYLITQASADVDLQNNEGNTALHYAALIRDLELVAYLVTSAGANTSIQNNCGFTVINRMFR